MTQDVKKGRPPVGEEAMMKPITIRLPPALMQAIEAEMSRRSLEGIDKATVVREWLVRGMRA